MWFRLTKMFVLVFLLAIAGKAASQPPADQPLSAELQGTVDGVQKFYEGVSDFKARFKQVVIRKHLPRPLRKNGMVFFKKPGMMRWDYAHPEKVYYISDGAVLWSYQPSEKLVYKLNVKDSELFSALKFLFGQGNLKEEFHIKAMASKENLIGLRLTSKMPQSAYQHLTLYVDPKTFEIRETELVDPLDNVSRITFESPSYEELKPTGFQFSPPTGIRIEELGGEVSPGVDSAHE